MNDKDYYARCKVITEEQLDLYAAKSKNGLFLSDEEVQTFKAMVEIRIKMQAASRISEDGRDLKKRTSKHVSDKDILRYASDEENEEA
jgi:hypothetical protein